VLPRLATTSLFLSLFSACLAVPAGRALAQASTPTLAVEDTMHVDLPPVAVHAPRVTIDEILDRVAKGEARRDSLMRDQTYTMVAFLTYVDTTKSPPVRKRQWESSARVYKKHPDKVREVVYRTKSEFKAEDTFDVSASSGMREQIVSFAFEPRSRAKYKFTIQDRLFVGGHLVYVLAFEPKSKLDPLPAGRVWVDTNEFVIGREEFWYRDRSPSPMFFKSIDSCVLERTKVDGKWWVLSRLLARVELTSMTRFMGRLGKQKLPPIVDLTVVQQDWAVNRGIDDAVFARGKK
jgi:hypothetical protein